MDSLIKRWFNKLKMIYDTYKIWIFALALFGTNGTQAYLNSDTEKPVVESTEISEVMPEIVEKKITVICEVKDNVIDHEKEHHGRR